MSTPSVFDLSPEEKLQLVEDLWDNLASRPQDVPVLPWQQEELKRRRENLTRHPRPGYTWEQVTERIRNRHES